MGWAKFSGRVHHVNWRRALLEDGIQVAVECLPLLHVRWKTAREFLAEQ